MGALSSLNLANSGIGELDEFPKGWTKDPSPAGYFKNPQGEWKGQTPPTGSTSSGLRAFADAIRDMGALTSLDISNQVWYLPWDMEKKYPKGIGVEEAKALAEALR
jgi:hypothetical protein